MNVNEKENIIDMLDGCRNRMCVTNSREELMSMTLSAVQYVMKLYSWNGKRIYEKEMAKEKEE